MHVCVQSHPHTQTSSLEPWFCLGAPFPCSQGNTSSLSQKTNIIIIFNYSNFLLCTGLAHNTNLTSGSWSGPFRTSGKIFLHNKKRQTHARASQLVLVVKILASNAGRRERPGFDPWIGKIPWRRTWQPTPVLLPGESHGQRSLAGCSPPGCTVGHDWSKLAAADTWKETPLLAECGFSVMHQNYCKHHITCQRVERGL